MAIDSTLLSAAIAHHQAGRFDQAHAAYQELRASEPDNATVLSLLGAVCINLKHWQEAFNYLGEAIQRDPGHHAAHDNLGVLLGKLGRYDEAVECFRRAVEINPDHAQTWLNLAAALERASQGAEAAEAYRSAARLDPNSLRAHSEAARLLHAAGRLTEAVPHYRQRARLRGDDAKAQFELAAVLAAAGQPSEAIAAYLETLRLKPDSVEACVNLTQAYIDKREYSEAERWGRRAVELRPNFAEAHLNLGSALTSLRQLDEAKAEILAAVRLKPTLPQAHNNLGIVLADEGDFDGAIAAYRESLKLQPNNPDTFYNLGIARLKQGDPREAIAEFDQALALKPNYAEAHHNRSSALLMLGQWSEGFAEYEWRFRSRDFPPFRPRWKAWEGGSPAGRTIVLVAEQGLGDTLQFVRYAKPLADEGARVIVECPAKLRPLLARTPGVAQWITAVEPAPEADGCVPLLSMPFRMRTTLDSVPAEVPYLFADETRIAHWREKLAGYEDFKVGIVWQGNPKAPGDVTRSIPLGYLEPLAQAPGVRLFSLQKGPAAEEGAALLAGWNVVEFGDALDAEGGAFLDTAAIMRNLDLVITSDTAAAHLAGGLGVPVWVALQYIPDWRWLLEREDSPWYPTMRLFRQQSLGDWPGVFARMAEVLRLHTAGA